MMGCIFLMGNIFKGHTKTGQLIGIVHGPWPKVDGGNLPNSDSRTVYLDNLLPVGGDPADIATCTGPFTAHGVRRRGSRIVLPGG